MGINYSESIESLLDKENIEYDAFTEYHGDSYHIQGNTYVVSISVYEEEGHFRCMTTHIERHDKESGKECGDTSKAYGNRNTFKKPKSVMSYIEKWTDK
ncbi:hypothetical protein bcgnr5390_17290 [Bacillus luti]|nr:hypothetical protein BC2903_54550 [Bacillus cereus]